MSNLTRFFVEMFLFCSVIATVWFGLVLYKAIAEGVL
jgi:hypothetical protein